MPGVAIWIPPTRIRTTTSSEQLSTRSSTWRPNCSMNGSGGHQQRTAWQTGHQVAQQWSYIALSGVEQAQRGVQHMYTFAATVQSNVAGMLAGTEERQYVLVEEAVDRANWRRGRSRLTVVLIMAVSVPLLFLLAYFLITHLY